MFICSKRNSKTKEVTRFSIANKLHCDHKIIISIFALLHGIRLLTEPDTPHHKISHTRDQLFFSW